MTGVAEEFEPQQRTHGAAGRHHARTGETGPAQQWVQVAGDQIRQEEEQAPKAGAEGAGREVQVADIGHLGGNGPGTSRALLVPPPGQAGKALLLEDLVNGHGAELFPLVLQRPADVVDGQVLLAEGNHPLAAGVGLGRLGGRGVTREEEGPPGVLPELMDQPAEAAGSVAEACGGLFGGQPLDKVRSQGFVLAVGRVGGVEEVPGECSFFRSTDKHNSAQ